MKATHQLNVLLVAEEAAGVQALRLLSDSGHIIKGVLTTVNSRDAAGRVILSDEEAVAHEKPPNSSMADLAGSFGVPVLEASRVKNPDFADWILAHHIDVLLNVHSLYRICPEVIEAVRIGSFNLHPGPLPDYSGLNVACWAVYNEEPAHAVTIHHISGNIDAGQIVFETHFPLSSSDTGLTVSIKCARKGLELIERLLNELSRDPFSIPSRPQDLSRRSVYKRNDIPGKGYIQWSEPAHKIEAFVRACNFAPFPSPWGEPKTRWGEKKISVLRVRLSGIACDEIPGTVGRMIDGKTAVATPDNWILLDKIRVDGEFVPAASFLNRGDTLTSGF